MLAGDGFGTYAEGFEEAALPAKALGKDFDGQRLAFVSLRVELRTADSGRRRAGSLRALDGANRPRRKWLQRLHAWRILSSPRRRW